MKYNPKSISPLVVWEITLKCNLNCLHCGSSAGKARREELSTKEALALCDDFVKINVNEVCLMGGEPLIRKDWYDIAKKIKDLDMRLDIITNGFHKNKEELISKLVKLDPFTVAVSIDGSNAKTHDYIRGKKGSFERAIDFLFSSREANLPPTVVTTVNKFNYKELPEIRDILLEKRIAWQIQSASPIGRFSEDYALSGGEFYAVGLFIASMQKQYSRKEMPVIGAHDFGYNSSYIPCLGLYPDWKGCPAGLLTFGVQSDGRIKGCLSTPDNLIEGNIRDKKISEIWNNTNAFSYNRRFKKENLGENCRGCQFGETCRGGCTSKSASLTGVPNNDPLCFYNIEQDILRKGKNPELLIDLILSRE